MRLATPIIALIAAISLAACGSFVAAKPDPRGDGAFITAMATLCSSANLVRVDAAAGTAAVTTAAHTDTTTVSGLEGGLTKLTPSLSNTSPLAAKITDTAQMLVDLNLSYTWIAKNASTAGVTAIARRLALTVVRTRQAKSDLDEIGVTSCLN